MREPSHISDMNSKTNPEPPLISQVIRDPVHWLAFGFGAGLMPKAPGTWGSALAVLLFLILPPFFWLWGLVGLCVMAILGIGICGLSASRLGVHDHSGIVFDEIVGMGLVLLVTPREPLWILAAFLAFRAFDIVKPWPIRDVDHSVAGGLGIMLDDVLAAAYAALLIYLAQLAVAAL